jgi:HPt (histidine-containing phosphotransfer) domain-containing protein
METFIKNSSSPETNTEKCYNLDMIEVLCRGDKEKVKKMIALFIEQMPLSIEQLKSAESKNDYSEIKKITHKIKPIVVYYSLTGIEKTLTRIEQLATIESLTNELKTSISDLGISVSIVIEQLKKDFSLY